MVAEFGLLGTIEAHVDGRPADVGHLRQRAVLAALLVDTNRPVPVDELVDRVWGDRAPQRARGTLYGYLSRLRQALASAAEVRIVRQPGGYLLEADPLSVDLHRFRDLAARARTADDGQAAELTRRALRLWRGTPFATVDTPWFSDLRHTLERERLSVELDDTDLRLRRGLHGELLPALTARTGEHPLDERLAGQLILALYRSGRPADALTHYQAVRRRLAEELGVDPGAPLQRLHQRVLTGDPALALTPPRTGDGSPIPRQLPSSPYWFTGRDQQLAELDKALAPADRPGGPVVISAIGGSGGVGKTRLALQWAYQNLDRFPDGQLYVDLRGFDPSGQPVAPAVALRGFLDALGVESGSVPLDVQAQTGLYRSLVQGRRMLIVLDNAADAGQAAALLPGSAGCTVLVTSRRRLAGLASAHGARLLTLDVLTAPEAAELLTRHLGQERAAAEPEAVAALLEHCAGLPLAISVVGARAAAHPDFPLAVLAEELRDESTRLDALDAGDLTASVRAAFTVSYRALTAGAAEVLRLVGIAPGPEIGQAAVACLVARPIAAVRAALRELENAHLVQQPAPGRYRLHDLARLHAVEQARREPADGNDQALTRLVDFYLHTALAGARQLDPHQDPVGVTTVPPGVTPQDLADHGEALAWFTTEHPALLGALDLAARTRRDAQVCRLARALETFFDYRGHWHDWATSQHLALDAAQRLGEGAWEAAAHRGLGNVHTQTGRLDDGRRHFHRALELYERLGDRVSQAHTHRGLGWVCHQQERQREALGHAEQALELYRQAGHRAGQAKALNNVGWLHSTLGDHRAALHHCTEAVALNREAGDPHGEAGAWDSLGYAHHHLGEFTQALDCYRRALELDRSVGDRYGETEILGHLGDTHLAVGDDEAARLAWRHALEIADETGHPASTELRDRLSRLPESGPRTVSGTKTPPAALEP
ncbi:AfsR/SARP family transcriptional regulator [Streptomyces sp. SP18CS02]|uniref:AfsR/SARP family transcriptional regulator n=1 Tax=Streptomyces sp. SP18CS02 TaxID=3002531 RepID=UPI002E799986|nr:BTAD domain-containing putative transcriptional regulator [Streptomyces sp. SP18CS02]MEE1751391.1 BTAD domain-containing putative transcriptional regulator [Streptomyces sp. SP18CS02]